jgi:hypothetical protein
VIERLRRLAERIRDEVDELEHVVDRAQKGWHQAQTSGDDLYLDGVALNLHGFYAGLERLFQLIAVTIDGDMPQGANWHQLLLERMEVEVPTVRPAVISADSRNALDEYRGFRHVVRNVYTHRFDPAKMQVLVEHLPSALIEVRGELLAFAAYLDGLA